MSASSFEELECHVGHKISCVGYGRRGKPPYANVAIECETCGEVMLSYDFEERDPDV